MSKEIAGVEKMRGQKMNKMYKYSISKILTNGEPMEIADRKKKWHFLSEVGYRLKKM